jgi:hypothetical protein
MSVYEQSCKLIFASPASSFVFPFELGFLAPARPSISFPESSQLKSDSAAINVHDFAPFSSISSFRISIGLHRVDIRNFIIRSETSLFLQFSINCADCSCCSGSAVLLTVSHQQFPMMSSSASVFITNPNARSVFSLLPSVLPSTGGENVEIQIRNFPTVSPTSFVSVSLAGANPVIAYQVDADASGSFSTVHFFSPPVLKGIKGFSVSVDGVEQVSGGSFSFSVVDLIVSGFCNPSSVPAFGNVRTSCFVKNLPSPSSPGEVEFSCIWPNNTALASYKDLSLIELGSSVFLVELNLPNVAKLVPILTQFKLQVPTRNFAFLPFSVNSEVYPSPASITFVEPAIAPNNQETKVAVYVEYFQGSLPAVQAALNGIPMPRESFSIEIIDVTRTAFYFGLPRALKAGNHSVSFWSADNDPLSFTFTALDALTPRLKYIFPTQGTTKGGDSISIVFENYDAIGDVSVFLGTLAAQLLTIDCSQRSCFITAMLPATSISALLNITLSSELGRFTLPQQFETIQPAPRLDFCNPQDRPRFRRHICNLLFS